MAMKLIPSAKFLLVVVIFSLFTKCSDDSKGSSTTLGSPVLLDVSTVTPTTFIVNWLAVSGATSYYIDIATDMDFSSILTAYNGKSITGETFEVTNLLEKTTYYVRLKASNGTSQSDFSNIKSASTLATVSLSDLLVTVAPVDRKFYSAKHEPETGILHGAGQDYGGFKDYAATVGKPQYPIICMTYVGLTGTKTQIESWGVQLKNELASLPKDIVPQIGLNMTGGKDTGAGQTVEIARGDYDVQIVAFAQAVKDLGRKSFVRIGYEFEGSWNGYNAQGYINSFIKIATELRRIDANTATVWCSGGG